MRFGDYMTPLRVAGLIAGTLAVAICAFGLSHSHPSQAEENHSSLAAENAVQSSSSYAIRVETVHPKPGGIARTTSQPGSAHSYESAELYSKVSGYLQTQNVDIGSRVKQGDILAVIYVPELTKELEYATAMLQQTKAEVIQMQSRIASSIADQKAAEAYVTQTEAEVQRHEAEMSFREKQYNRIQELSKLNSVEDRLVDEKLDQLHAAEGAVRAAHRAVLTARQQAAADEARVAQARADLVMAQAKVRVAEASLEKAQVMVAYTKITSPYDGVITRRNFYRGAFIRAPDQGGQIPLLCVDRMDLMRVVVQIPDREVPYTNPGDKAKVRLDALPDHAFAGQISRVADAEDPETRAMRIEIDLPNPAGLIRDGMYGKVDIELEPAPAGVTISSACLVGNEQHGKSQLFVVKEGKARLRPVNVGKDTGVYVEVLSGLTTADEVIVQPPAGLADGNVVTAAPAAQVAETPGH
jgi:RND family efflux transporter MFP subunit